MKKKLYRLYFILFIPFAISVIVFSYFEKSGISLVWSHINKTGTVAILVFSGFTGIIFPIWNRLLLIKKFKDENGLTLKRFYEFEKLQIIVPLTTLYLVLLGYFMGVPKIQEFFVALFGFYAAYYSFPVSKKIDLDKKIFRVRDE